MWRICHIAHIIDFVVTQWDKHWFQPQPEEEKWYGAFANTSRRMSVVDITDKFCITNVGQTFHGKEIQGAVVYKNMCSFLHMEMCILMERLHCIHYIAFSDNDPIAEHHQLGVLNEEFKQAVFVHINISVNLCRCLAF